MAITLFGVLAVASGLGAAFAVALAQRLAVTDGAVAVDSRPVRLDGRRRPAKLQAVGGESEAGGQRLADPAAREAAVDRSRRELVAWVSDDLRTPLAGMAAMGDALEGRLVVDASSAARYHRTVSQEADRLVGVVDDLLELSLGHHGGLPDTAEHELDRVFDLAYRADGAGVEVATAVGEPDRGTPAAPTATTCRSPVASPLAGGAAA